MTQRREVCWDKVSNTVDLRPGNTIDKSGWLNLNISDVTKGHRYKIKGETYVRIFPPLGEGGSSIVREVWDWSRAFWKD